MERIVLGILMGRQTFLALLPPRRYQCKLRYERGFTRVTIFFYLASATHRQTFEDVYAAAANSKELYTLLYGRRPDSPPSSSAFDPPPDRIKPGAFGSRPRPP